MRVFGGFPVGTAVCVAVAVAAVTLAASAVAQSAPSQVPAAVVLETKTARSVDSAGESQPEPYSAHWRDQDGELCEAMCLVEASKQAAINPVFRGHPAVDPTQAARELCTRFNLNPCRTSFIESIVKFVDHNVDVLDHSALGDMKFEVKLQFPFTLVHNGAPRVITERLDVVHTRQQVLEACAEFGLPSLDKNPAGACMKMMDDAVAFHERAQQVAAGMCRQACRWWERLLPDGLGVHANRGRTVLGADGKFVLPKHVTAVALDVGAHRMENTRSLLDEHPNLAVIACEPLWELVSSWPPHDRIVALPVAVDNVEGLQDFHINKFSQTSSLGAPLPEFLESLQQHATSASQERELLGMFDAVATRPVPVVTLATILEAVPESVTISSLKVDAQGRDLRILQSAKDQLARVRHVVTEAATAPHYEGEGVEGGTDRHIREFMASVGFDLVPPSEEQRNKVTNELDLVFINRAMVK